MTKLENRKKEIENKIKELENKVEELSNEYSLTHLFGGCTANRLMDQNLMNFYQSLVKSYKETRIRNII